MPVRYRSSFAILLVLVLLFGFGDPAVYAQMKSSEMLDIVHMPIGRSTPLPSMLQSAGSAKTPLVTGNGCGFAVVSLAGSTTKFYLHPYRFEKANPDITKDGVDTVNLIDSLSWSNQPKGFHTETRYLDESQIISSKSNGCEQLYFMPFGIGRSVLVTVSKVSPEVANSATSKPGVIPNFTHALEREDMIKIDGHRIRYFSFRDMKTCVAVVPLKHGSAVDLANMTAPEAITTTRSALSDDIHAAQTACALVAVEDPNQLTEAVRDVFRWQNDLEPNALIDRELKEFESWRVRPNVKFASADERSLWRQSETFLRMAQIREPNTDKRFSYGLILASLPDGVWFTPWVRDMSYSVVALIRMGHLDEARKALLAYMNARPVGLWKKETRNLDYQISVVRYFGDGSEEADYSGCSTENIEFDDWGLALWTMADYFDRTHDLEWFKTPTYRGTVYQSMRDYIVKPLLGNLDPYGAGLIVAEDSSLWEEHQANKKHFADATIAAINGLNGFYRIADAMHDYPTLHMLAPKLKQLETGFKSAFSHDGVLWGTVEPSPKNEIDGSLVEAFNWDVIKDPAIREKTLKKMELLKTASGGYRRVRGSTQYETHEFLFIDFYLARLYYKLGMKAEADRILEPIVRKSCQDNGIIPEMYVSQKNKEFPGEIGDPTGSTPMVGFGSAAYIITLIERNAAAPNGR